MENLDDCLELWRSVLVTAITDFHNGKGEHNINYRNGARAWFESSDLGVGSLVWICQQLGLDHRAVREAVANRSGMREKFSA